MWIQAQGKWQIIVNKKTLIATSEINDSLNTRIIKSSVWKSGGYLEVNYTEASPSNWIKSLHFIDEVNNELIKRENTTHTKIKISTLRKLFAGKKENWRGAYDVLAAKIAKFGADVTVGTTSTYVSLLRNGKKFGIIMPSAAERLDIGIKFKGVAPTARLEASGTWHNMVTHRVRVTDPKQIDKELLAWLKQAYDAA